ncbi:MAG: hypothetical protein AAF235_00665 [Planctomycetota bacterium]
MSPVTGGDLLKVLGSGVRPAGLEGRGATGSASGSASGVDFATLLAGARSGSVQTGLPVSIDAGLGIELNATQHERLSAAVDQLEASGARRGVVLIDGRALVVDVESRSATGVVSEQNGVFRADAVVSASAPAGDVSEMPGQASDPLWTLANNGLGRMLAG